MAEKAPPYDLMTMSHKLRCEASTNREPEQAADTGEASFTQNKEKTMNLYEAISNARDTMDRHGLTDWALKLSNGHHVLGTCYPQRKEIRISRRYIENNDATLVQDTVLHEVAHALAGPGHGHDAHWREICYRIGCAGTRQKENVVVEAPRWVIVCNCCGETVAERRSRKMKLQNRYHKPCGTNGTLRWARNPKAGQLVK